MIENNKKIKNILLERFHLFSESEKLSHDEILTASLILHHLQVLQFNAHEIYETRVSAVGQTRGSKTVYTAVGVYPTVALFNHECAPAVTRLEKIFADKQFKLGDYHLYFCFQVFPREAHNNPSSTTFRKRRNHFGKLWPNFYEKNLI